MDKQKREAILLEIQKLDDDLAYLRVGKALSLSPIDLMILDTEKRKQELYKKLEIETENEVS